MGRRAGPGSELHARRRSAAAGLAVGVGSSAALVLTGKVLAVARAGRGHPWSHRLLDLASALVQPKYPVRAMSTYLNGFHGYADDMGRQVEASHFCSHLRHDLHQCVIYDSNAPDARLIGIEYIISAERFRTLPPQERRLWHSHRHEVTSGVLLAPGVPELAERRYFHDLVSTYGKTFHTWQYDRDDLPLGMPQLMMAFTADGQADEEQVAERDRRLGVSSATRRRQRASIPRPPVEPGADAWLGGRVVQTEAREREASPPRTT